jgi:Xaa-Pro aminopeptidase
MDHDHGVVTCSRLVSPEPPTSSPRTTREDYATRRARIARTLGDSALILHGGEPRTRSNDTEYRFRPDSDFHYLTGLAEPGAIMVLRPEHETPFTLFVRPKDRAAEVWSGRRVGPQGAIERFGADAAHPLEKLTEELPKLLDGAREVHLPFGRYKRLDNLVLRAIGSLHRNNRTGKMPPEALRDARVSLGEDRVIKDDAALAALRHAVDITVDAHLLAMRAVRPGMHEHEIEAIVEHEFRRRGSTGPGYGSIVGAGDNATILHYVENSALMRDGELLLVDAGAEWDLFSGDLTRTYPVGGRFTPAQRALYDVVLEANRAGIETATVGSDIDAIHARCLRVLCEGLVDLGLLSGSVDAVLEDKSYQTYYPHRTSHWLGVDVHDAGYYCVGGKPRPLQPGMVLTVEPGLYVPADDETAPVALRGCGIRIEDDVLVRDDGPEVLTHRAPKDADALESLVGSRLQKNP